MLERFLIAQKHTYQQALLEIKSGRKQSHWIWWIFPQMEGLGKSERSKFYGIHDREEAIQYINHPLLRERLIEVASLLLERDAYKIFGPDILKVRACMLLFESVSDIDVFKKVINKYMW